VTGAAKKKIAILGGGCAAMAAAHYLSNTPALRERLEVTVYQMGWRLGGKGASGRNSRCFDRIEEHGLHMWAGFYDNAFRLMRDVYRELGRPAGSPLATFDDAFKPHRLAVVEEHIGDEQLHWPLLFPANSAKPGLGRRFPSPWDYARMTLAWLWQMLFHFQRDRLPGDPGGGRLLPGTRARRVFISFDLALSILRGVIRDRVFSWGFAAIDEYNLVEWLARHGPHPRTLSSAPVQSFYDYFFAFQDGDPAKPRLSAGIGLKHMFGLVGGYKGAIYWKLQSGMGDTMFAPLYEVLCRRSVRFRFFHEVRNLGLSADKSRVNTIRMAQQVTLRNGEYQPLVDVDGLPSWPSEPLCEQIRSKEAQALRDRDIDLEDPFAEWGPAAELELEAGRDFDAVVLGIPLPCFPYICREPIAAFPEWRAMTGHLPAVQTLAMQLWFTRDRTQLGWPMSIAGMGGNPPLLGSWVDTSQVLPCKPWTAALRPGNVSYFCGVMPTPPLPDGRSPSFAPGERAQARESCLSWVRHHLGRIFPKAVRPDGEVDWDLLVDAGGGEGVARFDAQFANANCTPSARYVQNPPGSSKYRPRADATGLTNLLLAGDWVYTGLGSCVESAVMSGMQAARALTGQELKIVNEVKCPWSRPRSVQPLL
jgi:uncharacterized protein with NAD-binding domain and iron-sulfur cluster